MPVSDEYLVFLKDQLAALGEVTHKRMFGGAGLYCGPHFFAIVVDDELYFKVDDSNRGDYEAADCGPFTFTTKRGTEVMNYYEVPIDILENKDAVCDWAEKAVHVAATAKKKTKKKTSKKSSRNP